MLRMTLFDVSVAFGARRNLPTSVWLQYPASTCFGSQIPIFCFPGGQLYYPICNS